MIWYFLAGMIAGAAGLYRIAAHVVQKDEEELAEAVRDPGKRPVTDPDVMDGLTILTRRVVRGCYLTSDEVVQVLDIYNNALKRHIDEQEEGKEREQTEIGSGNMDGPVAAGKEGGGEGSQGKAE